MADERKGQEPCNSISYFLDLFWTLVARVTSRDQFSGLLLEPTPQAKENSPGHRAQIFHVFGASVLATAHIYTKSIFSPP